MENDARDNTDDWELPQRALPPTVVELEAKIDGAIAIARASENAAMVVGAAAIESAEQARRAADLAVKASEMVSRGVAVSNGSGHPQHREDERMARFSHRADRLRERLVQLQRR